MTIKQLNTGVLGVNTYLCINREEKRAFVVDPGGDADYILRTLKESGASLSAILLTHCHLDHIGGVYELKEKTGAPVYIGEKDAENLHTDANLARLMFHVEILPVEADVKLKDGQEFAVAGIPVKCLATPGHTEGSCCYLAEKALFAGDTIFYRSAGRCDLPTGDAAALSRSVKEKIFTLPGETVIYPGHGERTTVAAEKKYNPFFQG